MEGSEENYTVYIEETGDYTYVGKTARGQTDTSAALWQIMRVDFTSGALVEWADGSDKFEKVWDDRAGYTFK